MNVTVPTGPNTATVQVLDANGADITGSCAITASSSDPTVVLVGNPDPASPNVIPLVGLTAGSSADVTYTGANASGTTTQTDTITVAVTAPAGMVVTYGTSIPMVNPLKPH
jgi:hypothetical protein